MLSKLQNKKYIFFNQKGFSLIELMVVVAIFVLISSILLANFPKFSSRIALENLVYENALSLREAQIYGLSVREFNGSFNYGYGIHFDTNNVRSFILFADVDNNKKYTINSGCGLPGSECVEKFNFQTRDKIEYLCWGLRSALPNDPRSIIEIINDPAQVAIVNNQCNVHMNMDISFKRPNPDAIIKGYGGIPEKIYADAEIVFQSSKGIQKAIIVWSTGQISVE